MKIFSYLCSGNIGLIRHEMDVFLLIIAFLCMLIGIIGCIIPGLPGTPIAYAGLWIAQTTDRVDFSWQMLLIWGIVTIVVSVLDYVVPAWGTKRYGGTKWGVWGSTIGVFVGLLQTLWHCAWGATRLLCRVNCI